MGDWRIERLREAIEAVHAGRSDRDVSALLHKIMLDLALYQRPERAPTTDHPSPARPPRRPSSPIPHRTKP